MGRFVGGAAKTAFADQGVHEALTLSSSSSTTADVFARLAPGADVGSAQAELRHIAAQLYSAYPESYPPARKFDIVVTPWKEELTSKARPTLMILLGTTILVLIIACANVANLTLTRLVQRERHPPEVTRPSRPH